MAKRNKPAYEPMPIIHDHFDGSTNCVECGGDCQLFGCDLAYSNLLRAMFEAEAYHGQKIAYMAEWCMRGANVPIEKFRERAKVSMSRIPAR